MIDLALPAVSTVPTHVLQLPSVVEVVAVTTGALSGALHARNRNLDITGVMVVAICTGVGGGAIRDVMLDDGIPTFLSSPTLLLNAVLAAIIGTIFGSLITQLTPVMAIIDSLLVGVWVCIGVQKSLLLDLTPISAAFVGVVAAVGGALLRDILCQDRRLVLRPGTFNAAAAAVGAAAYLILAGLGAPVWASVTATIVVAGGLRGASQYFGWETPSAPGVSSPAPAPDSST